MSQDQDSVVYCESCAMPLARDEDFGSEKDGSRSKEYCYLCYKDGAFIDPDLTMEEMIEISAKGWSDFDPEVSYEKAEEELREILPQSKRWQQN